MKNIIKKYIDNIELDETFGIEKRELKERLMELIIYEDKRFAYFERLEIATRDSIEFNERVLTDDEEDFFYSEIENKIFKLLIKFEKSNEAA